MQQLSPGKKYRIIQVINNGYRWNANTIVTLIDHIDFGEWVTAEADKYGVRIINTSFYILKSIEDNKMSFTQQQKADAQKQLANLEAEMNKLKDIINAPEKSVLDLSNETRYYVTAAGRVYNTSPDRPFDDYDSIGNCFPEKSHAEAFSQQFKIWCLVNSRAAILADGWKPDWVRASVTKYRVIFLHDQNSWDYDNNLTSNNLCVYLPSQELATKLSIWLNEHVTYNNGNWLLDGKAL